MKLKKELTEEQLVNIAGVIDNEGFGYMLLDGELGECSPEFMLDNLADIIEVNEAINIIREYSELMPQL